MEPEQKQKEVSPIKGYSFNFECEGHCIDAWVSVFSGLERVFVDGMLVAEQRNFNKHSRNTFSVGNATCSTSLDVESLLKGPFVCTFIRNGRPFKRQSLVLPSFAAPKKRLWYQLGLFAIIGAALGTIESYFVLPSWFFWVSFVLIMAVSMFWYLGEPVTAYIEEEEYV